MVKDIKIIKRSGSIQEYDEVKITKRLQTLQYGLNESVDVYKIVNTVSRSVCENMTTTQIDELSGETAVGMITDHPDYGTLAARITISNHQKNTDDSFFFVLYELHETQQIAKHVFEFAERNKDELQSYMDFQRDFNYDYFGFKTLQKSYLLKTRSGIKERPQHMIMRVSCGIHCTSKHNHRSDEDVLRDVKETYESMSNGDFTHATPTLYNMGTPKPQGASCFLMAMKDDSIDGIYNTLHETAMISKHAGGIGIHLHNVRSKGSKIRSNNGVTSGILPMMRNFNATARYVNQAGKRNGAFAMYLEPWHADVFAFLDMRKNHGDEEMRCRDLFSALWIPDLFMERVKNNKKWSLMCPDTCKGLSDVYGDTFKDLYEEYENKGMYVSQVNAIDVWYAILDSQISTGTPYLLYKDASNRKSNQKNLGVIKSSNLCAEIIEYSEPNETAVCNLASISLPSCIVNEKEKCIFDFDKLGQTTRILVRNLNKVIDVNYYPVQTASTSNFKHRPIGIGCQGLADVFIQMQYSWDMDEAKKLNKDIYECMYYHAMSESLTLTKQGCESYSSFNGSPLSQGIFQFDMWGVTPSSAYDWDALKAEVKKFGVRNSLLIAQMPTASTSQILGNTESIEPMQSNIFTRRTQAGEFTMVNKYLVDDLNKLGLWNKSMMHSIVMNNGSIQSIQSIPESLKNIYKTSWEISQKHLIDMSADRGAFVCQSQSLNLFLEEASYKKLSSMHFYAFSKGLKTGIYYLRTRPKATAHKVVANNANANANTECEMCSA